MKEDSGWLECKSNIKGNLLHRYHAGVMKLKMMILLRVKNSTEITLLMIYGKQVS